MYEPEERCLLATNEMMFGPDDEVVHNDVFLGIDGDVMQKTPSARQGV